MTWVRIASFGVKSSNGQLSWQQGSSGGQSDAATATKPPTVPRLAIATDH